LRSFSFSGAHTIPQYAAFIDAGYLRAEGARALGVSTGQIRPNAAGCVTWLEAQALRESCSLLRAYWYDGAFEPGHQQYQSQRTAFNAIASCPGIQLRLGHIREDTPTWHHAVKRAVAACGISLAQFEQHFSFRPQREQKGVDTLIVLDLVRLAQHRAYDCALLLAGDRDLAEAVRVAQDEGRRVIVAHPERSGVATELRQLADEVIAISAADLQTMLTVKP
jgi:uncharacterized LabA/DUF88 family protein